MNHSTMQLIPQALLVLLIIGATSSSSRAADLTGTYEGRVTCTNWSGFTWRYKDEATVEISQSGDTFVAKRYLSSTYVATYAGELAEDSSKPNKAQGSAIACEDGFPTSPWSTMAITKAIDKDGEAGKITAEFVRAFVPAVSNVYSVCKFSGKRTSGTDPLVACP